MMENRRSFIKMLGALGAGLALGVKSAPAKKRNILDVWDKQLRADVQNADILTQFEFSEIQWDPKELQALKNNNRPVMPINLIKCEYGKYKF